MIEAIAPGTTVYIKPHCEASAAEMIVGLVLSTLISTNDHLSYKVRHWNGGQSVECWYESFELELPKNVKPVGIGFIQ